MIIGPVSPSGISVTDNMTVRLEYIQLMREWAEKQKVAASHWFSNLYYPIHTDAFHLFTFNFVSREFKDSIRFDEILYLDGLQVYWENYKTQRGLLLATDYPRNSIELFFENEQPVFKIAVAGLKVTYPEQYSLEAFRNRI